MILDRKRIATCLGLWAALPCTLTGQAYKGGPNTGVFLQITCDDANDLAVSRAEYPSACQGDCSARRFHSSGRERGRLVRVSISALTLPPA